MDIHVRNVEYMDVMTCLREKVPGEVFDYQVLKDCLSRYRKPRDAVTRLLSSGRIIRIKKGLYCFGQAYRRAPISREYLANLIYGPSYVSLDYALSYYGMIPERVHSITSVTINRSRRFETPVGLFYYRTLTDSKYSVGAVLNSVSGTSFMIASPEKALVDKVWTDGRFSGRRISDYEDYLADDLRIGRTELDRLDREALHIIAESYDSVKVNKLVSFLRRTGG